MRSSIIVIYYNGVQYMENCLSSLCAEIEDDEIIVVDNASSDGGPCLVSQRWPQARLIQNQANRGFAAACNQAAREARGNYLVFLNQDTVVRPGWLPGLLDAFAGNPSVGLATSKLMLMSQPEKIHACGLDIHFTGLTSGRGFLAPADAFAQPARVSAVAGASFAISRPLWQQLGGFDEALFMYYEDTDLSWRARLAGYECWYAPASAAYHDYRPARPGFLSLYYAKRNRCFLLLKTWRWPTLVLLAPSLLLAELLEWAHAALVGWHGLSAKGRASLWLLAHLPAILRSRRQVQQARQASDLALLETCASLLHPLEFTGGTAGRLAVAVCNILFRLNVWFARQFCRLFHL